MPQLLEERDYLNLGATELMAKAAEEMMKRRNDNKGREGKGH